MPYDHLVNRHAYQCTINRAYIKVRDLEELGLFMLYHRTIRRTENEIVDLKIELPLLATSSSSEAVDLIECLFRSPANIQNHTTCHGFREIYDPQIFRYVEAARWIYIY